MTTATRLLSVDDHPVLRQGLDLMFGDVEDLDLIGTVETAEEAVEAVARLEPQVVLVDVRLPGMDGLTAVRRIRAAAPGVRAVVFSAYGDRRLLADAIAAGASGYVLKGSPPEDLVRAVRSVAAGRPFVDPSLSPMLVMTDTSGKEHPLAEREREVLRLLAEGLHTEEVAERMGLGSETVKGDLKRALGKLKAETRPHAVAIALRRALIG